LQVRTIFDQADTDAVTAQYDRIVAGLVLRMATENLSWGYMRVRREALIVRVGVRDHHRWSVAAGW
jgi:hypothetical protein